MPTLQAGQSATITTSRPGGTVSVDCTSGAIVRVDWIASGGISGSRTVRNAQEEVPSNGQRLPDGARFTLTCQSGTATYADDTPSPVAGDGIFGSFDIRSFGFALAGDESSLWMSKLPTWGAMTVVIPDGGTLTLQYAAGQSGQAPAGLVLRGAGIGRSTIVVRGLSGAQAFLSMQGVGLTLEDLTIDIGAAAGDVGMLVRFGWSSLTLRRVQVIGRTTAAGGVRTSSVHGVQFPNSGTQDDLTVEDCDISGLAYCLLKTNTSTAANTRVRLLRNRFHNNWNEDCSINSPAGPLTDVLCSGNSVYAPQRAGASDIRLGIAFASGRDIRIIGNDVSGDWSDAYHVEEEIEGLVVSGNTGRVSRNGLTLTQNNISGTRHVPSGAAVTGNAFTYVGSGGDHVGICVTWDASGSPGARDGIVSANVMRGFPVGFRDGSLSTGSMVWTGNSAIDCDDGYHVTHGGSTFRGNVSTRCARGILGETAMVADHTFVDCPLLAAHSTGGAPMMLRDYRVKLTDVAATSGGTQTLPIARLFGNDRILDAEVIVHLRAAGAITRYFYRRSTIAWDGTTLTNATVTSLFGSSFSAPMLNASSYLKLAVADTGNSGALCAIDVEMRGLHLVS